MISPESAPAGTVVICVNDEPAKHLPRLRLGGEYVVAGWEPNVYKSGEQDGFAVMICGVEHRTAWHGVRFAYRAARFRKAVTPESLGIVTTSRKTKQREKA